MFHYSIVNPCLAVVKGIFEAMDESGDGLLSEDEMILESKHLELERSRCGLVATPLEVH